MTCFLFSAETYSKDREHGWRLGDFGGWVEPNRGGGRQICVGDASRQGWLHVKHQSSQRSTPIADGICPQLQRSMCRSSVRVGNDVEFYLSIEDAGCGCERAWKRVVGRVQSSSNSDSKGPGRQQGGVSSRRRNSGTQAKPSIMACRCSRREVAGRRCGEKMQLGEREKKELLVDKRQV